MQMLMLKSSILTPTVLMASKAIKTQFVLICEDQQHLWKRGLVKPNFHLARYVTSRHVATRYLAHAFSHTNKSWRDVT